MKMHSGSTPLCFLLLLIHHNHSMDAAFYYPNFIFHSFIQAENRELPPQHQVTPSNLYQAAFCHMNTSSKLELLLWKAHHSSSKKYGNVALITLSLSNLNHFTYTTLLQSLEELIKHWMIVHDQTGAINKAIADAEAAGCHLIHPGAAESLKDQVAHLKQLNLSAEDICLEVADSYHKHPALRHLGDDTLVCIVSF